MGRRTKPNKLPMSTIAVTEEFKEQHRRHKPSSWTWEQYIVRKLSELSSYKEKYLTEKVYYEDLDIRFKQVEKVTETYFNFLEGLTKVQSFEEFRNKLEPIISSKGSINIGILLHNNT